MPITVTTNNVPRPVLDAAELTAAERGDFDYLNWPAIERGEESASFFRYLGQTYDLGELQTTAGLGDALAGWDGYTSWTYFSGVAVRIVADGDAVVVGRYFAADD